MKKLIIYSCCCWLLLSTGCAKSFLEVKSTSGDETPRTIAHYQALLDDAHRTMNRFSSSVLGMVGGDELFVENSVLATFSPYHMRNAYTWKKDNFWENEQSEDWNYGYRRILFANMALEGIEKLKPEFGEQDAWNNVKGSAHFYRAISYYELAQLFCPAYDAAKAANQLGLPLRTDPDITLNVGRSSLEKTYQLILDDLKEAEKLVPQTPLVFTRPAIPAIHALRARVYLQMRNYEEALNEARLCLQARNELLDLNTYTDPGEGNELFAEYWEVSHLHPEVIYYHTSGAVYIATYAYYHYASPELLASYESGDLRGARYFGMFNGLKYFRGTYNGSTKFTGLAVDEVVLIQAECEARVGTVTESLRLLNRLRRNRIASDVYAELQSSDRSTVTRWVLEERRRELVFRGTRWPDICRLNAEGTYSVTIERNIDGEIIQLNPGDPRFVWPLPPNVVELGGIEQNPR